MPTCNRLSAQRALCLAAAGLLASCQPFGGDESRSSGTEIPSSLTWISTSLAPTTAAATRLPATSPAAKIQADSSDGDFYLSYRITPSNLEGRLIYASLMVGRPGAGKGGSALFLVSPTEHGYDKADVPDSKAFPLFNLNERLTMGEGFRCCWETYPDDEDAYSGWFEIMMAYTDVTFPVSGGALAGEHTVRTAFADVRDLGYRRGDLLYKTDSGWAFVDSATGAFSTSRPQTPLQLNWVRDFDGSGDGRGNQHIRTLFVAVQDSQKVHMPAGEVLSHSWEFIADFILTDALIFRRIDPVQMTSVAELLAGFDIRADTDNASGDADGLSVNFYAIKTPLDQPRPNDFKDSLGNWIQPPPPENEILDP